MSCLCCICSCVIQLNLFRKYCAIYSCFSWMTFIQMILKGFYKHKGLGQWSQLMKEHVILWLIWKQGNHQNWRSNVFTWQCQCLFVICLQSCLLWMRCFFVLFFCSCRLCFSRYLQCFGLTLFWLYWCILRVVNLPHAALCLILGGSSIHVFSVYIHENVFLHFKMYLS